MERGGAAGKCGGGANSICSEERRETRIRPVHMGTFGRTGSMACERGRYWTVRQKGCFRKRKRRPSNSSCGRAVPRSTGKEYAARNSSLR